jgi:hypothetical protein
VYKYGAFPSRVLWLNVASEPAQNESQKGQLRIASNLSTLMASHVARALRATASRSACNEPLSLNYMLDAAEQVSGHVGFQRVGWGGNNRLVEDVR